MRNILKGIVESKYFYFAIMAFILFIILDSNGGINEGSPFDGLPEAKVEQGINVENEQQKELSNGSEPGNAPFEIGLKSTEDELIQTLSHCLISGDYESAFILFSPSITDVLYQDLEGYRDVIQRVGLQLSRRGTLKTVLIQDVQDAQYTLIFLYENGYSSATIQVDEEQQAILVNPLELIEEIQNNFKKESDPA